MRKSKMIGCILPMLSIIFTQSLYANDTDEIDNNTDEYRNEAKAALDNYYKFQERIFDDVISQSEYDGFNLEWEHSNNSLNDLLVEIEFENRRVLYQYNDENLRIAKNDDGKLTTYTYNNGRVETEKTSEYEILYIYNGESPIGFVLEGKIFNYEYTNDYITEILYDNKEVCRYGYGKDMNVHCVYSDTYEIDGKEVKISEINHIMYNGVYTDFETGWIYLGRYYDIKSGRYIDGISKENMQKYIKEYGNITVEMLSNINDIDNPIIAYDCNSCSRLFSNENKQSAIFAYSSLSAAEQINIIAKTIYFESSIDIFDQIGVASVIQNRMKKKGRSAFEIVSESGEFGGYEMAVSGSYNIATGSDCWSQALANANRLYYGNPLVYSSSYYNDVYDFRALKGAASGDCPKFKLINGILYVRTQKNGSSTFEYVVKVKELYCPVQEKVNNDYYTNKYVTYNELGILEKRYGKMEKYNVFFKCK